jgi:hypothetical protein
MRTEAPPAIWEADTEDTDFLSLLGEMIVAALRPGNDLSVLTLSAANVVVTTEPTPETAGSSPAGGEYVAVSVTGPGAWSTDWSWIPDRGNPPAGIPFPSERLLPAKVRYAYGRALPSDSSVTVFLARKR